MTMLSGRRRGRCYRGVLLMVFGVAMVQAVRGLLPPAVPGTPNPAALELVYSRGETAPVLPRPAAVAVGEPRAAEDLRLENFMLGDRVRENIPSGQRTGVKWYTGAITNQSRLPYQAYLVVRFRDGGGRDLGVVTSRRDVLPPGKRWDVHFTAPDSSVTAELLEVRGAGHPGTVTMARRLRPFFAGLLCCLVGFALHIGLASWLRPRGWERRLWEFVRG